MTTEAAVKIGELVVDEETGEILEMPEGIGEPIAWLTHKANEAKAAKKAWTALEAMFNAGVGRLLKDAALRKMTTQYGSPGWRSRTNQKGRIDRLPQVKSDFELTRQQVDLILTCAKELDPKALLALPEGVVPLPAIHALIDESQSEWVQIQPLAPQPPEIERARTSTRDRGKLELERKKEVAG